MGENRTRPEGHRAQRINEDRRRPQKWPLEGLVDGDADLEAGVAGDRGERDSAAHLSDKAMDSVKAEPGTVADALGGEERLEDAGLNGFGDAGAVVTNFDEDFFSFANRAQ